MYQYYMSRTFRSGLTFISMQVDDTTYHRTEISTQGQNPYWPKEEFTYSTMMNVWANHRPRSGACWLELWPERVGLNFDLLSLLPLLTLVFKAHALKLRQPELDSDDPIQFTSSGTLYMTPLPPFIADLLPQYHLSPTPSSCPFLD